MKRLTSPARVGNLYDPRTQFDLPDAGGYTEKGDR